MKTKVIAMYLPQFHRIPENDLWWGEGYTDWIAVKNAKPVYEGQQQPRIPLNDNYYDLSDKDTVKGQAEVELKLVVDGDYLYFYSDNDELLTTYMKVDQTAAEQYENLMLTGSCDLTKVNWPRRADGSSDYEGAESPIGSDIMTVKENLRLRSGEGTSSQVVTVLPTGSRVRIMEVGKAETIDGISSNWVRVVVLSRSKNRDGKPIREGTVGWCFGGYLE